MQQAWPCRRQPGKAAGAPRGGKARLHERDLYSPARTRRRVVDTGRGRVEWMTEAAGSDHACQTWQKAVGCLARNPTQGAARSCRTAAERSRASPAAEHRCGRQVEFRDLDDSHSDRVSCQILCGILLRRGRALLTRPTKIFPVASRGMESFCARGGERHDCWP